MDHNRSFHSDLYTSLGEDLPELPTIVAPAKPSVRPATLGETCFVLSDNRIFIDKILPPTKVQFTANSEFPLSYFVALHRLVAEVGPTYPPYTANFCGARIPLKHTKLNIPRWRHHLIGYDEPELVQFLEFGFPIGLETNPPPVLSSSLRSPPYIQLTNWTLHLVLWTCRQFPWALGLDFNLPRKNKIQT